MLGQFDFDKIYSLDVFDDITKNPPSIPVLDHTVFNFEYVFSTLFGTKYDTRLQIDKYHISLHFDKAITISKEIVNLNPNHYTDVHKFDNPSDRSHIIFLSWHGYNEFNNELLKCAEHVPTMYRMHMNHISIIKHYHELITPNEICEAILFHHIQDPTSRRKPNAKCTIDDIKTMTEHAITDKLHFMRYCVHNNTYQSFMKQYIERFESLCKTFEPEIDASTRIIDDINQHIEWSAREYTYYNGIRNIIDLMTEIPTNAFMIINNAQHYYSGYNECPNYDEVVVVRLLVAHDFLYSRNHHEPPREYDKYTFVTAEDLKNKVIDIMNDISLIPKQVSKQYSENIHKIFEECQYIAANDSPSYRDITKTIAFKYELHHGKYNAICRYIQNISLKHKATLLRGLYSRLPTYSVTADNIVSTTRERDEARSQVSDLQTQIAELQRQLAATSEADTLRSCLAAERQNTITMHRAYDEERAKNKLLLQKLEDVLSVFDRLSEPTSS